MNIQIIILVSTLILSACVMPEPDLKQDFKVIKSNECGASAINVDEDSKIICEKKAGKRLK